MIRYRMYLNKDKETEWLNRMAADGWAMRRFFAGFYGFEKCEAGEYIYQVDFVDRLFSVSRDYRELMEDAGIEIVQTWGFWVILRKKASEGKFDLYTDIASSIEHYKKIRKMFKAAAIIEIICIFFELLAGIRGVTIGYAFALLLGAILVALLNGIAELNNKIRILEERMIGIEKKGCRSRSISGLLAAGLLMNSCAIMVTDAVSQGVRHAVQLFAILLMLAGLYQMISAGKR